MGRQIVSRGGVCAPCRRGDGYTKWCTKPDEEYKGMVVAGCDDYEDKCAPLVKKFTESAQGATKSVLLSWILANIKSEGEPEN